MQPSYQSGFYAPGRGVAKHPELWRGCVGAWNPGLGNTGLVLRDWSGNQNNGTLTNGPTWGVSGGRQALDFDGVDDYVAAKTLQPLTKSEGLTLSVWTKIRTLPGKGVLIKCGSGFSNGYGLGYGAVNNADSSGSTLNFLFDGVAWATCSFTFTVNTLTHTVLTVKGNTAKAYVDGQLVETDSARTLKDPSSKDLYIGGYVTNPSYPRYLDGNVSDTTAFNRALSQQEIRTLAQRPGIAYELAPRKTYFIQAATSTSQFYDVLSPLIFAGTN